MRQVAHLDDVARESALLVGSPPLDVVELPAVGSLRTFRARHAGDSDIVVRVDEDGAGQALAVEGMVLDALATAVAPPIAPVLLARGDMRVREGARPFLAYPWIGGNVLDASGAAARARDVGGAFARLHAARIMDLYGRLQRERPLTLLVAFRRTVDEMKAWMAAREIDGLGQDLLTLALADLQRALRPFCIAQDHLFLTARRRVLCHGRPQPSFIVVRADAPPVPPPLCFVGLEGACLGDGADDLAAFSLAAGLDENAEDALLRAYLDELDREGRLDRRFLPRYFARRTLGLFAQPVARLDAIVRLKRGELRELGDPVAVVEEQVRLAYAELTRAMNGLRDLGGRARPVGVPEVMAMGRILAVEELILAEHRFRIAVTGQPYVGKTEIASRLAQRLKHRLYGTAAMSRALALIERDDPVAARAPKTLAAALFDRGFSLAPKQEPPFYVARLVDMDVTEGLREDGPLHVRGAQLLDDESVRAALREELRARTGDNGVVVEGAYAAQIAGEGARAFHLSADDGVRRARLCSHRPDVGTDEDAARHLARLDDVHKPQRGNGEAVAEPVAIDVGSRTAAAATLEILWHLLPPGRRPHEDLSGRAPL